MRLKLLISALLLALLFASCSNAYEWNQKLTVVVQTPDGQVSGSSVTRVEKVLSDGFLTLPEARGVYSGVSGEAVVVEVKEGQYLFVLLDGVDDLAHVAFPQFPYERSSEFASWARTIERHRGTGVVPPEDYPMMVMFEDISDPTSVRLVEPDDLEAAFGEGVVLKSIQLQITDDPVIVGTIEALLPWLSEISPNRLDGNRFERSDAINRAANSLSGGNFITGVKRNANFE